MENAQTKAPKAIYICPGDPYNSPRGGQTAFAVQALNAFGSNFALVAPDESERLPVGEWTLDQWRSESIWRFNIGSYAPRNKSRRPLIPRRIVFRSLVKKHLPRIAEAPTRNLFCDSPEILGVLRRYRWDSFCYRFAGLNNAVGASRYPWLRSLAPIFHRKMIRDLIALRPDALLASADRETIGAFALQNPALENLRHIQFFPTRFDPTRFFPGDPESERRELRWENAFPRLAIVGRLCWIKGWDLALEAVAILKKDYPNVSLRFVGDGEDRDAALNLARALGIQDNVNVEGFMPPEAVRKRLVAADVFLVASHREGWSVAATEALACGAICVSTNVSGANDMVREGTNGFVVSTRDPREFADAIRRAFAPGFDVARGREVSCELSKRYALDLLAQDWRRAWSALE